MITNIFIKYISIAILLIFLNILNGLSLQAEDTITTRPTVGLVLSGGGAKGLAHIGVLKVLEEVGIRPDYIGGTSMGSIIGGLYAIGYSADSLDKIARSMEWSYYLSDEIPRRNLTIEEKEDNDRFLLTFPVSKTRIVIPSGIVNGQNIANKLNQLCAPVYYIRNFDHFQIPYLCVATDIETGNEVVLREGYLPFAMRASMGIPSIFNPVEINNTILVDGGVVNNFPVNHVKAMGADIIIGVDVGFQFHTRENLNSIFRIIEQTTLFLGHELNEKNKSLCDILISPDIQEYSATSFNATDTLIALGEIAARRNIAQLLELAGELQKLDPGFGPAQSLPLIDSVFISEIEVTGLKRVSSKLIKGKLQIEPPGYFSPDDIAMAINRSHASLYFDKVIWQLDTLGNDKNLLTINVSENTGGLFRVGLHYDTNYKSAILLNTTFRNVLFEGSKLSTNLSLGENPYVNLNYFKNNGWKPGFGMNAGVLNMDVFVYNTEGRRISNLRYTEGSIQLFTQSVIRNSHSLGLGTELERTILKPRIVPGLDFDETRQSFLSYYGFAELDTYEKSFFPKRGAKMYTEFRVITRHNFDPVLFLKGRFSKTIRLSPRGAIHVHAYGGVAAGDSIPYQYYFYTGGINPVRRNGMIPFVGLDFMERANTSALILRADLQLEVFRNFYMTFKVNAGNLSSDISDLFTIDALLGGYGITFSYDSWIGPIEYTLMKSTNRPGMLSFVNIGYWF